MLLNDPSVTTFCPLPLLFYLQKSKTLIENQEFTLVDSPCFNLQKISMGHSQR